MRTKLAYARETYDGKNIFYRAGQASREKEGHGLQEQAIT